VGGSPEIVTDGVTGFLVPPSDPDAMARKLLTYVDHPALAETHGGAGKRRVDERFSLSAMLAAYREIYDALA
jgi:glycosyltransferase involved in cell wall biosynthesis